jgi:hypothetical protein
MAIETESEVCEVSPMMLEINSVSMSESKEDNGSIVVNSVMSMPLRIPVPVPAPAPADFVSIAESKEGWAGKEPFIVSVYRIYC